MKIAVHFQKPQQPSDRRPGFYQTTSWLFVLLLQQYSIHVSILKQELKREGAGERGFVGGRGRLKMVEIGRRGKKNKNKIKVDSTFSLRKNKTKMNIFTKKSTATSSQVQEFVVCGNIYIYKRKIRGRAQIPRWDPKD